MKSIGELMKELGFNPEGSESVQRAFIKNLIQAANESRVQPTPIHVGQPKPIQLEFDFSEPQKDPSKKVS